MRLYPLYASLMGSQASGEVAALLKSAEATLDSIAALGDPQDRLEAYSRLAEELRAVSDRAARHRGEEVLRIKDAEALSLAALAGRVGISKARADQLVRAARKGGGDA